VFYIELTIFFVIGRKRTVNFRNQRVWRHLAANYTIIMSRKLKVWPRCRFLRVILSSLRALCMLLVVSEEAKAWLPCFLFIQCIIKQLLESVFVISGKGYQPQASADKPYLDLDYSQKPHPIIVYCLNVLFFVYRKCPWGPTQESPDPFRRHFIVQ